MLVLCLTVLASRYLGQGVSINSRAKGAAGRSWPLLFRKQYFCMQDNRGNFYAGYIP